VGHEHQPLFLNPPPSLPHPPSLPPFLKQALTPSLLVVGGSDGGLRLWELGKWTLGATRLMGQTK